MGFLPSDIMYHCIIKFVTFSLAKSNQNPRQIKLLRQTVICPASRHLGRSTFNLDY